MNEDADPDVTGCPLCPAGNDYPWCEKHLLVEIDGDPCEGEYAIGLAGGTLYHVKEIEELILDVGKAAARTILEKAPVPEWIAHHPTLRRLHAEMVKAGDPPDWLDLENPSDVAELASTLHYHTEYRASAWWDVLWDFVECELTGYSEERNEPPSSSWERYYAVDAAAEAEAFKKRLRALRSGAPELVKG